MSINAYLRADGRKGIRNTVVVGYLVECAHHVSREIVYPYRDTGRAPDRLPGLLSERLFAQDDGAAVHASERRCACCWCRSAAKDSTRASCWRPSASPDAP